MTFRAGPLRAPLTPRWAATAILVLGWLAMLAWTMPGQMSFDTVSQLADGRSGHYDTWHPPVMAALLGLFDAVMPGTALFLLFMSGMALAALLWLLWLAPGGWGVAAMALLIVLTPQWLLYQSELWKDVLFANAALAGFAALARAAADWRRRWPWLAASLAFLVLAALARQNGLVLLPAAAAALALIAGRSVPRRVAAGYGAGFLLAGLVIAGGTQAALTARGDGGEGAKLVMRLAQGYDLVGALARDPSLPLPVLQKTDPKLAALLRSRGAPRWRAAQLDTYMSDPPTGDAVEKAPPGIIFAQWRDLVLHHPGLYLAQRWPVFWQVLATPNVVQHHPLYVGVDGDPDTMNDLGLARRWNARDAALARYAGMFIGTPLFSHLAFAAAAIALLILLLRRNGAVDLAVAGLLAGALLFALTFLIVSVSSDYRYLYFLDLATLTGAFHSARAFTLP